jgi:ribonucleoside-diphosphate reductase alpha chain
MSTNNYVWLNDMSRTFLERDYLINGQTVEERIGVICNRAEEILRKPGFAVRFKDNVKKGWYSFASPVWTNFGTTRGLPISCFGSHVEDSMLSILNTHKEVGVMSKYGGGTSAYFGNLRGRGADIFQNGQSAGPVHFMQLYDTLINVVSQGSSRRGQFAAYLPVDHPDIMEFLQLRSDSSTIQNLSFGVCVSDEWMQSMIDGDPEKRKVWARVLEVRTNTGYPYIFFTDTANRAAPACWRDKGLKITHSNLCTEIMEPDGPDESFVCDLGSMNILHFDEWKNTDAVELKINFLDAVMTEFIEKAKKIEGLEKAVRFAERHRALGLGWLGWHSYLQSKGIPFEGMEAKYANAEVARTIRDQADAASAKLALEYGEPSVCQGYGQRNAVKQAIAPTKSSSFILGQVSEGVEPIRSNYQIKDLQKGKYTLKNPHLQKVLEAKGMDTPEVWDDILTHKGSVQHLDGLSEREKATFKTFVEISPMEIVQQAAQRQKFIDQGQSVNLMIHPNVPVKDLNALLIEGWRLGVKSFYYQISVNAAQEFSRNILACTSCEA